MTVYNVSPIQFNSISMVTATLGTKDPQVGDVCRIGAEEYIFVYNGGNSDLPPGKCATVTGVSGYTVTVSSVGASLGNDYIVGVCKHATLTTATYGWLVTRGFVPIQASAAISIATGDMIYPGTNGFFTNVVVSAATSTGFYTVGKCQLTAASATSTGAGFVRV